jgi:hypothetical protein
MFKLKGLKLILVAISIGLIWFLLLAAPRLISLITGLLSGHTHIRDEDMIPIFLSDLLRPLPLGVILSFGIGFKSKWIIILAIGLGIIGLISGIF